MGGLARFDGEAWESERPLGPVDGDQPASDIAITPNGDVWVSVSDTVARYHGGWTTYTAQVGPIPRGGWDTLAVAPNGTVWGAGAEGPVRFDGSRWAVAEPTVALERIWVAPDGSVWGALPDGVARLTAGDMASE